jgi:hypothetical protein
MSGKGRGAIGHCQGRSSTVSSDLCAYFDSASEPLWYTASAVTAARQARARGGATATIPCDRSAVPRPCRRRQPPWPGANALGGARRVRSDGTPGPRAHRCTGRGRRHPPWGACDPGLLDAQRLVGRIPTARDTCPPMASLRTAMAQACSSRRPICGTASPRPLIPYRSSSICSDHVKKNLIDYLCIIITH